MTAEPEPVTYAARRAAMDEEITFLESLANDPETDLSWLALVDLSKRGKT